MSAHPPELLEAIDRLGMVAWSGLTYRHTRPGHDGLSGEGARMFGGRWNPPDSFPTIYLAQPRATCVAEFRRMAAGQGKGPMSFIPRTIHHVQITDLPLLDLTGEALRDVGLNVSDIGGDDWGPCQTVGAAAYFLTGCGLLAPSATGHGRTVVVFETRVTGDQLQVVDTEILESDEAGLED